LRKLLGIGLSVRLNKVALLATDGMTNRQIAGRVFLSPKSVDGV